MFMYLNLQEAIARGFELEMARMDSPDCYFYSLAVELEPKRDFMAKFLSDAGMNPTIPEGGYFMMSDWSKLGMYDQYLITSMQIVVRHSNTYRCVA